MDAHNAFATVLRRFRLEAGLTQEELAERSGLSANGLSALERGTRQRPQRGTLNLLVEALSLSPADAAALAAAARGVDQQTNAPTTRLPTGAVLGAAGGAPLIGRVEELDRIGSILASVQESRGHLLLLGGEAGVGKTRLLQELTAEAGTRGFAIAAVACDHATPQGPYFVFRRSLPALSAAGPAHIQAEAEGRWKLIRPRLQGDHSSDEAAPPDDDLLDDVANLVLTVAGAVPVAWVLDDVDAIDGKSIDMLHHLARVTHGSPVLIACALRDLDIQKTYPRLAVMLQKLRHDRLLDVVTVRRLSYDETAAFVSRTMCGAVSEEFAAFAHRRTKGNPRLLDGLVRSLGGRLQLEEEIGAGAMGRVFRAYDTVTQSTVAAKLMLARAGIDLDALLRFQQEGAVLRSMNHPNIVHIHDSFVEEHVSCIIMELLEGRSLARILLEGPLDLAGAKAIALQIADALAYAHSQSIVHRDVKPDNIMIEGGRLKGEGRRREVEGGGRKQEGAMAGNGDAGQDTPSEDCGFDVTINAVSDAQSSDPMLQPSTFDLQPLVKVTDFGIARILSVDNRIGTIATTGMRVGTPLYMAPEQIEGKQVDARSDIYGFGAVLYHMVTGRPPFEGDDALAIAVQQMKDEAAPPSSIRPGIPPDWDALILKALSKDPRRRFQSAQEMRTSLQGLGTSIAAKPYQPARRWRFLSAMAAALVVVVGGLAAYSAAAGQAGGATLASYLSGLAAQGRLSGAVLVAKHGRVILDRGYGLANRTTHVVNGPNTEYGLADSTTTALMTADTLQATQPMGPAPGELSAGGVCAPPYASFITNCPRTWRRITITQLVTGTSRLPTYRWGRRGDTVAQSLAACESMPLETQIVSKPGFTTCGNIVMALLDPAVASHTPAGSWLPTGIIPGGRHKIPWDGVNSKRLAWQLYDGAQSRRLALDYDFSGRHRDHAYNDYYAAYSTPGNLYSYDNMLFSGRYMSPAHTQSELISSGAATGPDPGIHRVQWADGWKTGFLFDSRVVYTAGSLYSFQTANLRFPKYGVTVIVMGNTATTDALNTAEHAAAFVLPGKQASLAATAPPTTAGLLGTYRRHTRAGDRVPILVATVNDYMDGLPAPFLQSFARQPVVLTIGQSYLRLGTQQRYSATDGGGLSVFGPPPGLTRARFCTEQQTDLTPTGYYHWSILGNQLTITKLSDRFCADRAELLPGVWTRVGRPAG
jgi:serine/threonine protein kinase/transcriptional regulator with XRE-family HTH domain